LGRSVLLPPLAAAVIAIVCAMAGMALVSGRRTRILIPLSGLLLIGVAVFALIPELLHEVGWVVGLPLIAAGFCSLALLDRMEEKFAGSLVAATSLHAFVDGWGMVAVAGHGASIPRTVSAAVIAAMLIHKVPEGLALGAMLRGAAPRLAIPLAIAAELPTVLGGATGTLAAPGAWVDYPLGLAAGAFLFLGIHAQHAPGGVLCADGETVAKHPGH
jgi:zinc transporter ZupT